MSRFINPVPEYKPSSALYFFKSGTNTRLLTYKDELQTILNEQPVLTDSAGNTPNVFYNGSAKLKVLDQFGVQYIERDPVGGEKELGDFSLWDVTVIYDLNDITKGSDNKFYISLSNANIANDPTTTPTKWEEIRFIGVWNTNITYAIGDVIQTSDGNLWKAMTATSGNNPSSDDGTNWLPAIDGTKIPEIIALTWIIKSINFTAISGESYQIDASANTVDITMPVLSANDNFTFHNQTSSTFKVQILNASNTINGPIGVISAGTDIELEPGNSVQLIAKSSTILEIVGAQA